MKTLFKIFAAWMLLAMVNCAQKATEPLVITKANCGNCHALPPADAGHMFHIGGMGYKCSYCHKGYAMDSTANEFAVNTATHRNGDTDVVFDLSWVNSSWRDSVHSSFTLASKQCNNVYCHGAIPQGTHASIHWNGTDTVRGDCKICHNLSTTAPGIYAGHYGHSRAGSTVGGVMVKGMNVQFCFNCHGANISDTAYSVGLQRTDGLHHIDGVFDKGSCRDCHTPDWTTWDEYLISHPGTSPFGKIAVN
jgi:predicted CxxxxCH...CXXCH cytochrome family protein